MQAFTQATRFGSSGGIIRSPEPLSNEQLIRAVPSIFAPTKHESRSDKYTYISTADMLDGMRKEGFEVYEARQGGSRIEGKAQFTKHMLRFRHASQVPALDQTHSEIVLVNSHDGTSSYQLMSGLFRLVCSNGLIRADKETGRIRVPHKGDVMDQVIEGAYTIIKDGEENAQRINHLNSITLNHDEQLAFAKAAKAVKFDADIKVEEARLLRARRQADVGDNMWLTLNRVQENIIRGGVPYLRYNDRGQAIARARTKAVNSVDQNVKVNQALWILAEEMQKLKAA